MKPTIAALTATIALVLPAHADEAGDAEAAITGLLPYLKGHDPLQLEQLRWKIMNPVASLYNNRMQLHAAIEMACMDVVGKAHSIRACDLIIEMDADVIVPGHGPITDKAGVRRVQDYLHYIDQEARKRYDAGVSAVDAAHDIALGDFASWGDTERIAVNVNTLYREYSGDTSPPNTVELFALMAQLRK